MPKRAPKFKWRPALAEAKILALCFADVTVGVSNEASESVVDVPLECPDSTACATWKIVYFHQKTKTFQV